MDAAFDYLKLAEICVELAKREPTPARLELLDLAERLLDMADAATASHMAKHRLH